MRNSELFDRQAYHALWIVEEMVVWYRGLCFSTRSLLTQAAFSALDYSSPDPHQTAKGLSSCLWRFLDLSGFTHPLPSLSPSTGGRPWGNQGGDARDRVCLATAMARLQQSPPVIGTSLAIAFAQQCLRFLQGQLFATKDVVHTGSSCCTQRTQVFLLSEPLPAGTDLKMSSFWDAVTTLKTRSFFYLITVSLE